MKALVTALVLALGLEAPAHALDLEQLQAWKVGADRAAAGDVQSAQARWDAVLESAGTTYAVLLARPCAGDLPAALAARSELAPLWVSGPIGGCHGVLWGLFDSTDEARDAAAHVPKRYLEGEPEIVALAPPLARLDAHAPRHEPPAVVASTPPVAIPPPSEPKPLPPAPPPVDSSLSAQELFARGNEAYARGDHPAAIVSYEAAIRKDPGNPRTHNNLGTALLVSDQLERAEAAFRKAVELDASYARAWLNLGTALYAEGRAEEARPVLERAVHLDPHSLDARSNLAALLVEMRQWADARDVLQAALVEFPDEPQLKRQLEQVHEQLAVRGEPAAKASPGAPVASGLAAAGGVESPCAFDLSRSRRVARATKLFQEGRSAFAQARYEVAEESFEQALECDPTSPAILNHLGAARLAAGRASSAAGAFELALAQDPAFLEASINLALARFEMGRCDAAIETLRDLVQRQASSGEAAFQLGRMLYRCGRAGEATTALERAQGLLPADTRPAQLLERLRAELVAVP